MAEPETPLGKIVAALAAREADDTLEATGGKLGPIKGVSDEELAVAFDGPAVMTNRFYGTLRSGGIRIAFCEEHTSRLAYFRTAVFLSGPDATALKNLLEEMIKDLETANAAQTKSE